MTPKEAYHKCLKENSRIPELENIIAVDQKYSYWYSRDVINGPWEKGEDVISTDSEYSYFYARDVIKGHWKLGEEAISKNSECSHHYACNIIKEPFEKGHSVIFNSEYKDEYLNFLKSFNYDMNKISEWML